MTQTMTTDDRRTYAPRTRLVPSKTNPRKTFDEKELEELAASMKEHGMISAIVARPHPKRRADGILEIVVGERRWRGAAIAGMAEVPVDIRELSDADAEELQHIENAQRADVPPLEEADSLARLMKTRTLEQVATRTGKSKSYIAQRAKLVNLTPKARDLFQVGRIELGVALELAKFGEEAQTAALEDFQLDREANAWDEPITVSQVRDFLDREFTLRLRTAPFDTGDAELVPAAGTCGACPKRTGNQGELFGDVKTKDDSCTDRACFAAKSEATYQKKLATPGAQVLDDAEAKKVFRHGSVEESSGFVALDDVAKYAYDSEAGERDDKTFRDALKGVDIPVTLARDVTKSERRGEGKMPAPVVELVRREDLEKIVPKLKAKWAKEAVKEKVKDIDRSKKRGAGDPYKAQQAKAKRDQQTRAKAFAMSIEAIVVAASKKAPTEQSIRLVAKGAIRMAWSETQKAIAERRGLELKKGLHGSFNAEKKLLEYADGLKGGALFGLLLEVMIQRDRSVLVYHDLKDGEFKEVAAFYKVNHAKHLAAAKAEAAAIAKERGAKKAARKRRAAKKARKAKARDKAPKEEATPGVCSVCGCTDSTPCSTPEGPCAWANMDQTLCTGCA